MCKNQNTWSHRTTIIFRKIKIIFHPLRSLAGFPTRVIVLWQQNVRGTRNASLAGDRYNGQIVFSWILILNLFIVVDVIFKFLRQRSNGLLIKYVCQQYLTCMCFLGFIWYNKTFIACGFRKYENLFTHEYHISSGEYDTLGSFGWIHAHISLTSME